MLNGPQLIVMLTYNDRTINNAREVFEACKDAPADFWGFKEEPLPLEEMKALCERMKALGKTTFLEVVAYSEAEGLEGAEKAVTCGFDVLMGTMYYDSVRDLCRQHGLKYMPYVGKVTERPSILSGTIDEIIAESRGLLEKGVYGFDLLGYRYEGDAQALNRRFVEEVPAPVCIAGSVNSFERLAKIKNTAPWAFTIGGAFEDHKFGSTWPEQIQAVQAFMHQGSDYSRT